MSLKITIEINKDGYLIRSSENDTKQWLVGGRLKDDLSNAIAMAITDGKELEINPDLSGEEEYLAKRADNEAMSNKSEII